MRQRQHDAHVWTRVEYARRLQAERRARRWYLGKLTRMTVLNQLRERPDPQTYRWFKDHWRRELAR